MGFHSSNLDPYLYIDRCGYEYVSLILYVDDVLLTEPSEKTTQLRDQLITLFENTNPGSLQHLLGMDVARNGQHVTIFQSHYVRSILLEFYTKNCPGN